MGISHLRMGAISLRPFEPYLSEARWHSAGLNRCRLILFSFISVQIRSWFSYLFRGVSSSSPPFYQNLQDARSPARMDCSLKLNSQPPMSSSTVISASWSRPCPASFRSALRTHIAYKSDKPWVNRTTTRQYCDERPASFNEVPEVILHYEFVERFEVPRAWNPED